MNRNALKLTIAIVRRMMPLILNLLQAVEDAKDEASDGGTRITKKEKEIIKAQEEKAIINERKELYKELLPVVNDNLRYLKSCLDLTESHITWGTKNVKKKYSIIKENILNKIKEQLIDKRNYTRFIEG